MSMKEIFDNDMSMDEDALIEGLIEAKGKKVEVLAFGIVYIGTLDDIDADNGIIQISDEQDKVKLEIERIESFSVQES
jgi:ferredoxin-fold anticodon binding domain-containing protein